MRREAIRTKKTLKNLVSSSGLLCITLSQNDYIAIGSSVFVGIRAINGSQIGISVCAPGSDVVQRFKFELGDIEGDGPGGAAGLCTGAEALKARP